MRKTLSTLTALGLAAACGLSLSTLDTAVAAPAANAKHVVVFGIDGLLFDSIAPVNAPNLDALIASGRSSKSWLYANPMAPTLSGPGWSSIATGVWPDKHLVRSNSWGANTNLSQYPDFLTRLERAQPGLSTYAIADWSPLTTDSAGEAVFTGEIDDKVTVSDAPGYDKADAEIAAKAAAKMTSTGPDASFVYFGEVDIAGHNCGSAGACYRTAIEHTDQHIGTVVDAIKSRPTYAQEDWTFLVTTDHGHAPSGGHGGSTPAERSTFVIQAGPGVPHETPAIKPKVVDITSTVLQQFGVAQDPALDGRPLGSVPSDPLDTKLGALQPRVDETGIPADVLGWTHETPSGWSIDNTGLGSGGMTEWRGWTLTTDDFWTRAQADQQRESNVRARGVFAVADSDEWADKAFSGSFNSTLRSPATSVRQMRTLNIGFGSHYLKEGVETASVLVSFDGGADKTVLTYSGDAVAKVEQLKVAVPRGASSAVVKWRLSNGVNNWYWAVDNPAVTASGRR